MEIAIASGDGSYHKLMEKLAETDLLVIDDWGWLNSPVNKNAIFWN